MALIRILLVDDHPIVMEGLKGLLAGEPELEVVGSAADGRTAVEETLRLEPDVVVLDVSLPEMNGIAAARAILEARPQTKIVVLTVHEDRGYVRELLAAGVTGFVLKRAATEELLNAIRAVCSDESYIDPSIAGKMINTFIRSNKTRVGPPARQLSEREDEILRLIARGHSNKEIAERLHLSVKTIETYKARSMEKLGVRTRAEIVRYGVQRGWLSEL